MKNFKIFLIPCLLFFILVSCETVSNWSESFSKGISSDDEVEIVDDSDQELLSDLENVEKSEDVISPQETKSDEIKTQIPEESLPVTPPKQYDSSLVTAKPKEIAKKDDVKKTTIEKKKNFIGFEPIPLKIENKIQYRVATISFATGSSQVDYKGLKKIRKIVKIAKQRNAKIKIVGHASKRTRDMPVAEHKLVNFKISDKRAHSVAKVFVEKYNFPRKNLITEAVSDSQQLFEETMPAGTKANQRTEIFLIY